MKSLTLILKHCVREFEFLSENRGNVRLQGGSIRGPKAEDDELGCKRLMHRGHGKWNSLQGIGAEWFHIRNGGMQILCKTQVRTCK